MRDEQELFDEVGCGGLQEGPEHSACASVWERARQAWPGRWSRRVWPLSFIWSPGVCLLEALCLAPSPCSSLFDIHTHTL